MVKRKIIAKGSIKHKSEFDPPPKKKPKKKPQEFTGLTR